MTKNSEPEELDDRCVACFQRTYRTLSEKFGVDKHKQDVFFSLVNTKLRTDCHLSSPEMQSQLNQMFCTTIGITDPYREEKIQSNKIAMGLYAKWKPKVFRSGDPFDLALRLAIAGNIMDYGANNHFDIHRTIDRVLHSKFTIDNSALFVEKIRQANTILYLGDNAGEIVFDKLFIETFKDHQTVFYAVKGSPILNDVTVTDANDVGMRAVAEVISNGHNAPSTFLPECSKEFCELFSSADLIISKGQGNLEGLLHTMDSRIFFLLMTKCDVISEILNVEKGSFIVYNQACESWN